MAADSRRASPDRFALRANDSSLVAAARLADGIERAEQNRSDPEILADVIARGLPSLRDAARRHLAAELVERRFAPPDATAAILRYAGMHELAEDVLRAAQPVVGSREVPIQQPRSFVEGDCESCSSHDGDDVDCGAQPERVTGASR